MAKIKSELRTIKEIAESNYQFNIPIYQRLYVWENEQIDTLLEDLFTAYNSSKKLFYLGGIIVKSPDKDNSNLYDLIDGQQRFTTLWLMSFELKNHLESFLKHGNELKIKFSIRKNTTEYFTNLLNSSEFEKEIIEDDTDNSLSKIINARSRIKRFICEKLYQQEIDLKDFSTFIFEKVHLIVTEIPINTDLNKLFEVTNNRGIQLQHHEILKAKILKHLTNKQERIRYGKIWDACSKMENYIERNLIAETGIRNSEISKCYDKDKKSFDLEHLFRLMIAKGRDQQKTETKSLNSILLSRNTVEHNSTDGIDYLTDVPETVPQDDEDEAVRSILTFPQLLLHTLRIYLFKKKSRDIHKISEKELLFTFKEYGRIRDEKTAKDFIQLLFEVRFVFDLFIIKWIEKNDNEEVHEIKQLDRYKQPDKRRYYLRRQKPIAENGFALLQSMLYHSQQITTHYWLTPVLYSALFDRNKETLYNKLKRYDNILFCTNDERTLPEKTWSLLEEIEKDEFSEKEYCIDILDENRGVAFPHYWFYKLEFVLWHNLKDEHEKWEKFRMTAKNSVEHVSPQNPEFKEDTVSNKCLNSFGNLALVSRNINSEYGRKPFKEKRAKFEASKEIRVDSLKLDLIYKNDSWNDDLCEKHKEEMKKQFEEYFKYTSL